MNFRASSIAASFEGSSIMVKPPMISFVSVNGPSFTVSLPPSTRTAAPFDE
jgi:hypothetical protein